MLLSGGKYHCCWINVQFINCLVPANCYDNVEFFILPYLVGYNGVQGEFTDFFLFRFAVAFILGPAKV